MSVIPQYLTTLQRLQSDAPTSLPLLHAVAMAAADTLPGVAGVALCLHGRDTRIAVGVSDDDAWSAEQWEYTIGAGPGLNTQRTGRATSAHDDLAQRWPAFHEALLSHTPFNAVDAVPLAGAAGAWSASLLLYYRSVSDAGETTAIAVAELAAAVGFTVSASASELLAALEPGPTLDFTSLIGKRMAVNAAVGITMQTKNLSPEDALDVLRAYAYTHNETIDHVGHLITSQQLDAETL